MTLGDWEVVLESPLSLKSLIFNVEQEYKGIMSHPIPYKVRHVPIAYLMNYQTPRTDNPLVMLQRILKQTITFILSILLRKTA